jgi:hypothetical protein
MAASPIDAYRRQIEKELQAGNATEQTHRPEKMLVLLDQERSQPGVCMGGYEWEGKTYGQEDA